jgi:hypothetical protein
MYEICHIVIPQFSTCSSIDRHDGLNKVIGTWDIVIVLALLLPRSPRLSTRFG